MGTALNDLFLQSVLLRQQGFLGGQLTRYTIHRECLACDGQVLTPVKRYAASRIRVNPDSSDKANIRRLIHQLFEAKVYPTLTNVLAKTKEEFTFREDGSVCGGCSVS